MNVIVLNPEPTEARTAVDRLVRQYGLRAVLAEVLAAALRGPRAGDARRMAGLDRLPDDLRRDIGLPPVPAAPRSWPLR